MAGHTFTGTHIALEKIPGGGGNGRKNLFLSNGPMADIVKGSVIAFADNGIDRTDGIAPVFCLAAHIFYQSIMNQSHIQGVGQRNGGFQSSQLLDLHQAGGFSEAVEHMAGCHHFILENVILTGKHHCHTGLMPGCIYGAVSHPDSGNIGDAVVGSRLHFADLQVHDGSS